MRKRIVLAVLATVVIVSVAKAVMIGFYPGLDKLIDTADAIVIIRIDRQVTDFGSPTLLSTHDCYVYQCLKGDIPANKPVRLQLMDARTEFVPPFAIGSTHLLFLTKKRTAEEPTDYRSLGFQGGNVRLSPFGHEKMPEGATVKDQIVTLLKSTKEWNRKLYDNEQAFLDGLLKDPKEPTDLSAKR